MSRAIRILDRFPNHFQAAQPGKLLGDVVGAMARDLDLQAAQIGAVRRSHRVREAETTADLMRIGALHGIKASEVDILSMRLARIVERIMALAGADLTAAEAEVADLMELWALELVGAPLDVFLPDGGAPEDAAQIILDTAIAASSYAVRRQALSRRIISISDTHARGNGTVRALLYGAANALDLDIKAVYHSEDRYLHAAEARDRLAFAPAPETGIATPPPQLEVFGIEENPLRRATQGPSQRTHTELFPILRRGFEPAAMEIRVTAEEDRTVGPMIVARDEGRGVGYAGTVPKGKTLVFSETGRASIDGDDVTAFAYGFDGAVFADKDSPSPLDAGFDVAPFVTTTPPGALDREAVYPHAGLSVPMPNVQVGKTRMAFFVQEGHFNLGPRPPERTETLTTTPRSTTGFFAGEGAPLGSVFAPGPDEARSPAALVSFAWMERQAYKVRVLIPARFRALSNDPEGLDVTSRVTLALDRFRPAGVAIETVFIDDRWVLGEGLLGDSDTEGGGDALAALIGGMRLWASDPEPSPEPESL